MSDIKDLALELIAITGKDVYSLLRIIKSLSTDEARAKIRNREKRYAAQAAWKQANTRYQQITKRYHSTKHK